MKQIEQQNNDATKATEKDVVDWQKQKTHYAPVKEYWESKEPVSEEA